MENTATGYIDTIFAEKQVNERFKTKEFVLRIPDNNPQYDQFVKFELHNDKCECLDFISNGDKVTVSYNLRGRKYQDKYFNSLQAYKIIKQQ